MLLFLGCCSAVADAVAVTDPAAVAVCVLNLLFITVLLLDILVSIGDLILTTAVVDVDVNDGARLVIDSCLMMIDYFIQL